MSTPSDPEPTLREQFDADVHAVEALWRRFATPEILASMERAVESDD